MAQRIGGFRRKTRSKLRKSSSSKGKISLTKYFQEFEDNERVVLKAEPAHQGGMYFPRFHGKSGIVAGKQGECYRVAIKDAGKAKTLIVHPVHLKKM
ncbi:MAG: 50S ribosomal protein L21e [Nanoarchaeota archaeon]